MIGTNYIGQASVSSYRRVRQSVTLGTANVSVVAQDVTFSYSLADAPALEAVRAANDQSVDITLGDGVANGATVRIYRADSYRETETQLADTTTFPYTDSGLNTDKNYKYSAKFFVSGTRGGSSYTEFSDRSNVIFTIADKQGL